MIEGEKIAIKAFGSMGHFIRSANVDCRSVMLDFVFDTPINLDRVAHRLANEAYISDPDKAKQGSVFGITYRMVHRYDQINQPAIHNALERLREAVLTGTPGLPKGVAVVTRADLNAVFAAL